ncbi:MAG: polyphenol oxidase family protein [Actinobacteria bacterium]|nr:polyphenol oxidase family protein [Actinomycetota bacterium]
MIRPPGFAGAAFGTAADGNGRDDPAAREAVSSSLGIPSDWAYVRQVHGSGVVEATAPGRLGDADALRTRRPGLPMAVATADCFPVVLEGPGAAGIAHAGWRGAVAGVVPALREAMAAAGAAPVRAAIGPGIGPCCFEVGPEVAERFPGHTAATAAGTTGVDLPAVLRSQLGGLEVWEAGECTMCGAGYHSYRRDGTDLRQIGVAWLP